MFKSILSMSLCLILMSACVAKSPHVSQLDKPLNQDPQLHTGQLKNGLRYMVRQNNKPEDQVEFRLVLNVGSLQENERQRGLAHLLEHIAFSGSKHFSKQDIVSFLEKQGLEMGNDVNAHTGMDETMYRFRLLDHDEKSLDKALLLMRDWAGDVEVNAAIFETDKSIVLEESRLHLGLGRRVGQKLRYFELGEAYSHTPIGKESVIQALTREDVLRFYRDWYRPELMAVVVVGNVEPEQVIAKIKTLFSDLKNSKDAPEHHFPPMYQHATLQQTSFFDPEITQSVVRLKQKNDQVFKERSEQDIKRLLVSYAFGSMLNQRLRSQDLASRAYVGAGYYHSDVNRIFSMKSLSIVAKKGRYQDALSEVLLTLEQVRRHGFQASELARIKVRLNKQSKAQYRQHTKKKSSYYASMYASDAFYDVTQMSAKGDYELTKKLLAEIDLATINAMVVPFDKAQNTSLVFLGHPEVSQQLPSQAVVQELMANVRIKKDIAAYVDDEVKGPLIEHLAKKGRIESEVFHKKTGITELILSNGARVLLKPTKHTKEDILFHAYSRGGLSVLGGEYRAVLKNMSRVLARSGLGRFSGPQLEKKLNAKKVALRNYVSLYDEGLKGKATSKDMETLFQLVHLALTQPNVDEAVFTEKTSAMVERMHLQEQTAWWKFWYEVHLKTSRQDVFNRRLLADDIAKSTAQELRHVLKDRFSNAGDFTFQFVGAFSMAKMKPLIERYLANLPATSQRESKQLVLSRPLDGQYKISVQENLEYQSTVMIRLQHHESYKPYKRKRFSLLKRVLREKLQARLREDLGLIYSARVSYRLAKEGEPYSAFSFHFDCAPENVDKVIQAWREVLANLRLSPADFALKSEGQASEAVPFVKMSMLKSIKKSKIAKAKKKKTNRYWAKKLHLLHVLDLPASRFVKAKKRLRYTPKAVAHYAQKYLKEDNVTIAVLNPKAGVKPKPAQVPLAALLH